MAGLERGDEPHDVIPMLADHVGADAFSEKRRDRGVGGRGLDRDQPPVREVAQSRAEAEAEHGAERKHVIGSATRVGVMLHD